MVEGWRGSQRPATGNGCRYATGWDYLAHPGEHGARRLGITAQATPGRDKGQEAEGQRGALCGRLRDHWRLPGASGKRGQTLGRAVPGGTRAATVTRENADRPHRPGLRFPWMELPQVQREAPDQAEQEERQGALSQGEGSHRHPQDGQARGSDPTAKPDTAWLGAVSPARSRQTGV